MSLNHWKTPEDNRDYSVSSHEPLNCPWCSSSNFQDNIKYLEYDLGMPDSKYSCLDCGCRFNRVWIIQDNQGRYKNFIVYPD